MRKAKLGDPPVPTEAPWDPFPEMENFMEDENQRCLKWVAGSEHAAIWHRIKLWVALGRKSYLRALQGGIPSPLADRCVEHEIDFWNAFANGGGSTLVLKSQARLRKDLKAAEEARLAPKPTQKSHLAKRAAVDGATT